VCDDDRHILALASMMEVAGNPTTTTPIFLLSISLENNLQGIHTRQLIHDSIIKLRWFHRMA